MTDDRGGCIIVKRKEIDMKRFKLTVIKMIKRFFALIGMVFLSFLIFWLAIIPIGNECILHGYAKELQEYDVGGDYEVVEHIQACGKLFGNGNGMEYLVLTLVKADTLTEILPKDYDDVIRIFRADRTEYWKGLLSEYTRYDSEPMLEKLEQAEELSEYYFLYSFHSAEWGSIWTWDLRGH